MLRIPIVLLNFMEGLSPYRTQVATVLMLYLVCQYALTIKQKEVSGYLIVHDSAQSTYNIFCSFFATEFAKLNSLTNRNLAKRFPV